MISRSFKFHASPVSPQGLIFPERGVQGETGVTYQVRGVQGETVRGVQVETTVTYQVRRQNRAPVRRGWSSPDNYLKTAGEVNLLLRLNTIAVKRAQV